MYSYERYNFRIITMVFLLLATTFFYYGEWIGGAISVVLAILVTFSYQGVKIDPEKKRFLKYDRFLKLRIGRWEKLPPPSYVTLVRINLSSQRTTPSPIVLPEVKKSSKSFKVNLVVEGERRFIPICRGSKEKMMEEALTLGRVLEIRVLDYTTHEKKWIL